MSEMKDPKVLGDQAHMGSPVPTNDPSASSSTAIAASSSISEVTPKSSGDVKDATSDPLFGATPSQPSSAPEYDQGQAGGDGVKERMEAGSEDRVESLKAAREAALHQTRQTPTHLPPPISHLSSAPRQPSTLIPYLRRLSTILSIILGSGALISLVWSALLLPLLHASFSARRALVDQQLDRIKAILQGLREIRAKGMFGAIEQIGTVGSEGELKEGDEKAVALRSENKLQGSKAMIRELSSSAHSSTSSSDSAPIVPLTPDLSPLLVSLRTLASTRSNTSTTRTSLLSTIESYTSALHRQLWNPRPGRAGWGTGYGLGTLDESLRAEGGKAGGGGGVYKDGWEGEGLGDRREEWDSVRKEIRGLKGLLLGRRSMSVGA